MFFKQLISDFRNIDSWLIGGIISTSKLSKSEFWLPSKTGEEEFREDVDGEDFKIN